MVSVIKVIIVFDSSSIEIPICSSCKTDIREAFDFCPYCGQAIDKVVVLKNLHEIDLRSEELKADDARGD